MSRPGEDLVGQHDPLPDEEQRRQLCRLLHAAFVELRCISDQPEQVYELAYAFHNLPLTIYGWGTWSISGLRGVLARYRERFPEGGPDYAAMLDAIYSGPPLNPNLQADAKSDGRAMAAALEAIAAMGGPSNIEDPVEWQRQMRADRPLPGRES